jgi:uncharacterized protein
MSECVLSRGPAEIGPLRRSGFVTLGAMSDVALSPTDRTTVRRLPARQRADRAELHAVLDEGLVCHVGFTAPDGTPVVIPTAYCRIDERLYLHGSPASNMLRSLKDGVDVCVTVTHIDAIVMARSAFHHSMNYRSAMIFGRAEVVDDLAEKARVLDGFVDHVLPDRAAESRPGNEKELKGTLVLALDLNEASVKARTGPPIDDPEDMALGIWAGVLPIGLAVGPAEPDEGITDPAPPSVAAFVERRGFRP